MADVFVSIGSNVDAERHVRLAVFELERHFGPLKLSRVYRNKPVGFDGDDFLNLVAQFGTVREAAEVNATLHRIEQAGGRTRNAEKFGPRTLDIDMLLYDDLIIKEPGLMLPREEITRYAFILRPLAELAGERRHPGSEKTYAELWATFDQAGHPLTPVTVAEQQAAANP